MRQITSLDQYSPLKKEAVLTIGNFDGVHRGHMAILSAMQQHEGEKIAIVFSTHPDLLLKGQSPKMIYPFHYRLLLLENYLDTVLLLPFTESLAALSGQAFLEYLLQKIPIKTLFLGENAAFGKGREARGHVALKIAQDLAIALHFLPPSSVENVPVSSSNIRLCLQLGQLDLASQYLGRPYRLVSSTQPGLGLGEKLGFKTMNVSLDNRAHPPLGVWAVRCQIEGKSYEGVANLGVAPTLKNCSSPLLEIHLFAWDTKRDHVEIEVEFVAFLRPEKCFLSVEDLIRQISLDKQQAQSCLEKTSL